MPALDDTDLATLIAERAAALEPELIEIRRDIHQHPEGARMEHRTTEVVAARLERSGLEPRRLEGTGLICDLAPTGVDHIAARTKRRVILRADLDALPLTETSGLSFASTNGYSHACGHDVHTAVVLGAGLVLADLVREGKIDVSVRLLFQPAEEVQPGGANDAIAAGVLEGYDEVYALHCDPKIDVGSIGSRIGPITSASDTVTVTIAGDGGHTSRPHLAGDVVFALGQVITQAPSVLGRRIDPRAGVNLTWGAVEAGKAANAIPSRGMVTGTLRCLDENAWQQAEELLEEVIAQIVAPYGVDIEVEITRGVPPVVNDEPNVARLDDAARRLFGPQSVVLTEQSLGGEDFGWYLQHVDGAMARLGVRTPGGRSYDLHQSDFVVDERAIRYGVGLLSGIAALAGPTGSASAGPAQIPVG
ncbi:amidohydrolase [Pseudactinotalea suaedae]|uniref:amidohydrolase n=1 Tax=Pseudactinotalea suaedae TaxID=1524924 RepID=UPI0012E0E0A9